MPIIQINEVGPFHSRLLVTIPKNEVSDFYKKHLNRYQQNANLKGFRKGKAPLSYVQTIVGSDILVREVAQTFDKEAEKFYKENNQKLFCPPLPVEGSARISTKPSNIEDCHVEYDIIYIPTLDLLTASHSDEMEVVQLDMDDAEATRILEAIIADEKNWAAADTISAGETQEQRVFFEGVEVVDGAVKEDGAQANFSIFNLDFTPEFFAQVENASVGATFQVDLRNIEVETDEAHVRSYFLNLEPTDEREVSYTFDLTIKDIQGASAAELNDEFAQKALGNPEATVEELHQDIKRTYADNTAKEFVQIMHYQLLSGYRDSASMLLEDGAKNALWHARDENEKEVSREEYDIRVANSIIKIALANTFQVQLTEETVIDAAIEDLRQKFGASAAALPRQYMEPYALHLLKENKEFNRQCFEIAHTNLLVVKAMEELPLKKTTVSNIADFNSNTERILKANKIATDDSSLELPLNEEVEAEVVTAAE